MQVTDPSTITGPMRLLPMQRRRPARHREPISTHEAAAEIPEDWTMPCTGRRCSGGCKDLRSGQSS